MYGVVSSAKLHISILSNAKSLIYMLNNMLWDQVSILVELLEVTQSKNWKLYWSWLFAIFFVNNLTELRVHQSYACNLAMSSSWSIVSKASDKSINKATAKLFLSRQSFHLSTSFNTASLVLNPFLSPRKNGRRNFPI